MSHLETLRIIHLDNRGGVLGIATVEGGASHVALPVRSIVADILRLGSRGLMISHNHPSGDPMPSRADIAATQSLRQVAEALGVRLHDHIVCGAARAVSFRALGLL